MMDELSIQSLYENLMKSIITLRQFKGTLKTEDEDVTIQSFESMTLDQRQCFSKDCFVELYGTYKFVDEFLIRNKDVICNYMQSLKSLFNVTSEFDELVNLKNNVLEKSADGLKGLLKNVSEHLEVSFSGLMFFLQMADQNLDHVKWFDSLHALGKRLKQRSPLYDTLQIRFDKAEKMIVDVIHKQNRKLRDFKAMINYSSGETEVFPNDKFALRDSFGKPFDDVEKHLRDLHIKNMEKLSCGIEDLTTVQQSLEKHIAELDKFKILFHKVKFFNDLFSKFRKSRLFDVLDNFHFLYHYDILDEQNIF